jgi:hypothetical protein
LSLSWVRPIQPIPPDPISLRSISILFIYLSLGLPCGLFPSGFSTSNLYASFFSPIRATCPVHVIFLCLNYTWRRVQVMKLLFTQSCSTLSLDVSSVQIFSPAPCSQMPSVYIAPLKLDRWKQTF